MALRDFSRLALFLEKEEFSLLPGVTYTDAESVEAAQSIWDAAINAGDTIPVDVNFPTTTLDGVTIDWDEDQTKFVLAKNDAIVRDNLQDDSRPRPVDMADNDALLIGEGDEYMLLKGSSYDGELMLLDVTA